MKHIDMQWFNIIATYAFPTYPIFNEWYQLDDNFYISYSSTGVHLSINHPGQDSKYRFIHTNHYNEHFVDDETYNKLERIVAKLLLENM